MKIGNSTGSYAINPAAGMNEKKDPQMEGIKKQIKEVQDQIKKLDADKNTPGEMKEKKKKELEQNLQNLQNELAQRKMEVQKEAREKAAQKSQPDSKEEKEKVQDGTMDQTTMQGVVTAGNSLKQVRTVKSVQERLQGRANVVKVEIKLDEGRGGATDLKKEELADLEQKANAAGEQIGEKIGELEESINKKTENSNRAEKEDAEKTQEEKKKKEEESEVGEKPHGGYHPIDIYL